MMTITSISFDDDSDEPLQVFSGNDLLINHYGEIDIDWHEVAERTALDERRGLIVLQVGVIEDLLDELIQYLEDPDDPESLQAELEKQTIGPRIERFQSLLQSIGLLDPGAQSRITELRRVVRRRNVLAHGTLALRPVGGWNRLPVPSELELEWLVCDRRTHIRERITTRGLRDDLYDAIGLFTRLLEFAEMLVQLVPAPVNFRGGHYLAAPSP
jgi:hypothetical protein